MTHRPTPVGRGDDTRCSVCGSTLYLRSGGGELVWRHAPRNRGVSGLELDALRSFAETGSTKLASRELGLTERSLKRRLKAARQHLGVETTVQAVWVARDRIAARTRSEVA